MKKISLTAITALSILSLPVHSGGNFTHKDWEISCDNTLTCRIAGYSREGEPGGSVLFTRPAGSVTQLEGKVMVAEYEEGDEPPKTLSLWINGKSHGLLPAKEDHWVLSNQQSLDIIEAINDVGLVEFKGGKEPFVLSYDGSTAVFVKADETQGRINTPGALVKRGHELESSVKNPVPAPVIYKAKTFKGEPRPLTDPEIAVIRPKLMASLSDEEECERIFPEGNPDGEMEGIDITPLDKRHSLISALCWRAAYNEGIGYWTIDNELKGNPVLVTTSASDYGNGELFASHKGRGLGDCWSNVSWVWDGSRFQQSRVSWTGMCRLLRAGGTWDLPTEVTKVVPVR